MDLRAEISYDAGPDDVFQMLCDEAFRTRVCQATGSSTYDVTVSRDGEAVDVRIQRVMPADLPELAKKIVGETIEVVQTEHWDGQAADGTRKARLRLEIPGQPGAMNGSVTLSPASRAPARGAPANGAPARGAPASGAPASAAPSGGGTHELITGEVKVGIPLVGKKLESEVVRGIKAAISAEEQIGRKWLAGDR
ncbi:MAG: DUF2505 domain-containing protein [Nocardioidaceae bacterium]